eukprot:gene2473-3060_t
MDDSESRKKRLEELKKQSLEMEKEAQEREKRNEERRKQREEQLKQLQEQEKKDEEERQRKREERKKQREEEERKFNEEMKKLDDKRQSRIENSNSSSFTSTSPPLSSSTSSLSQEISDPELRKQQEEREKRLEERRKQREEAQRQIELEEKRIQEEREKRREERRLQMEEENKKLQDLINKKDSDKEKLEQERLERENQEKENQEKERLEKERLEKEKEAQEKERLEKERLEKENQEKERLEKERLEKEKEAQEKERLEKERLEKERVEKENQEKEKLEKEKAEQERLEKERLEKERLEKEKEQQEKERLEKEQQEKERLEKERVEKENQEKERLEKERLEKERLEKERVEKENQEKERLEKENQEKERLEKERLEKERLEKENLEKEKLEKERLEKERLEKEKAEKERLEKEKLEKERLEKENQEKERLEKEKLEKEKAEQERLEKERLEKERLEKEKQEKERLEKEKLEKERLEKEKQEKERLEKEKLEKERLEKEKQEKERLEKEKLEKERLEKERLEKEKLEKERVEKERLEKEKQEKERLEKEKQEKERLEKEKQEKEKLEKERLEKEKQEKERLEKEKQEKERLEKEKLEKEKQEKERLEKERLEKEKQEKERLEKEKLEKERVVKEKQEKERLEKEKQEKERLEKEKKEKERLEKEKLEKEKKEKERLEKEKLEKEKLEKERLEKEKLEKEKKLSEESKAKITDNFKLSIENQLKAQLESKNKQPSNESNSPSSESSSPQMLTNLTLDRVKFKGRKQPTKKPTSSTPATSSSPSTSSTSGPSVLSQALEARQQQQYESPQPKKKIILPPGAAGGLLGGMAALAMEAQKKKLEKDNKLLSALKEEAAPTFVKGRSQSVSVTSTMKTDPSKFLAHKKTVDTYSGLRTRLIHCKGKKRILTKEVETSINSLNKCDTFVLDCGIEGGNVGGESQDNNQHSTIYVWYGSKSTANKKSKAVGIAEIIKSHERGGHATIVKLDEGDKDDVFYKKLGGTHTSPINPDGGDDLEAEQGWAQSFTLLKYIPSGEHLINMETKVLSMDLLASDSYFILDTGTEFYEWSGRNSDQSLKDAFHKLAQDRLKNNKHRQTWVESIVISEGGEPVMFREKFADWPDLSHEVSLSRMGFGKKKNFAVAIPYEKKSPAKMNHFEVHEMINWERAEEQFPSDGKGEYEAWYIENSKFHPLPKEEYGHFYSGNCYLIRYTYTRWNALKYIIFFWQGVDASRQDVGSSSLLTKDLYIETSARGECFQEAVRQGRESNHFLMVFNGRMAVHRGCRGEFDFKSKRLYHVFGKKNDSIHAAQTTKLSASQLNSRDVFILTDSTTTYIWESKGATKSLKEESVKLAALICSNKPVKTIKESSEPEDFWKMIGGNQKYANFNYLYDKPTNFDDIKLFAVTNTGTVIRADPLFKYSQYDLVSNRVFIFDNCKNIFIWSGSKAPEKEKKRGTEIALDYLKLLKDGRSDSDVLFITENEEPLNFTCYFHSWDSFRFFLNNGADSNEQEDSPKVENAINVLKKYYQTVPYDQLLNPKTLPPEIDKSVLEMYLSDDEFKKVFNLSKQEWEKIPAWKKIELKKTASLF